MCDQVVVERINALSHYERERVFELVPAKYIEDGMLNKTLLSRLHSTIRKYAVLENFDPDLAVKCCTFKLLLKATVYTCTRMELEKVMCQLSEEYAQQGFSDAIQEISEEF